MQIIGRRPQLPERGKIKIGMKGAKQTSRGGVVFSPPKKLDHFLITTLEKDENDNYLPDLDLMQAIGERTGQDPKKLKRIPVRLLYNDPMLSWASRYSVYSGTKLWCSGDGQEAQRLQTDGSRGDTACPCERIERDYAGKDKCKINGNLSVIIDGAPGIGGVWKLRTTSFNTVDGITGALMLISQIAGGQIAGVPLELVVSPKRATDPTGKAQTIHVVGLEYRGTMDELREAGVQRALANSQAQLRIEHIEDEARKAFAAPGPNEVFEGDEEDDIVPEFFPDDETPAPDLRSPAADETSAPAKRTRRTKEQIAADKKAAADIQDRTDLNAASSDSSEQNAQEPEESELKAVSDAIDHMKANQPALAEVAATPEGVTSAIQSSAPQVTPPTAAQQGPDDDVF